MPEIKGITEITVKISFEDSYDLGSQWIWICTGDPSCKSASNYLTESEARRGAIDHLSFEHSAKISDTIPTAYLL